MLQEAPTWSLEFFHWLQMAAEFIQSDKVWIHQCCHHHFNAAITANAEGWHATYTMPGAEMEIT
jgi:hypothetical protein